MVEKNGILAFMHIISSFYNLFTVQTILDSLLLLLFNLLITIFPILLQSITEKDIRMDILEKHPKIY